MLNLENHLSIVHWKWFLLNIFLILLPMDITNLDTMAEENYSGDQIQWDLNISQEQIEEINQMLEQSIWTDLQWWMEIVGYVSLGINIIYILLFIFTAIWLYKLSKKLWDRYSWLAFIPLIQVYTLIKTAGYSFWKWFFMLLGFSILAVILWGLVITWLTWTVLNTFNSSIQGMMIGAIIIFFISLLIIIFVSTYFLYAWIARRSGQSWLTAVLMALFPWCMLWIVANRISEKNTQQEVKNFKNISQEDALVQEL